MRRSTVAFTADSWGLGKLLDDFVTEIDVERSEGSKTRVTPRGFYVPRGWRGRIFNALVIRRARRKRASNTVRGFKRLLEGWPPPVIAHRAGRAVELACRQTLIEGAETRMSESIPKGLAQGRAARAAGRLSEARAASERALAMCQGRSEEDQTLVTVLKALGQLDRDEGLLEAALHRYQMAVAACRRDLPGAMQAHTVRHLMCARISDVWPKLSLAT